MRALHAGAQRPAGQSTAFGFTRSPAVRNLNSTKGESLPQVMSSYAASQDFELTHEICRPGNSPTGFDFLLSGLKMVSIVAWTHGIFMQAFMQGDMRSLAL